MAARSTARRMGVSKGTSPRGYGKANYRKGTGAKTDDFSDIKAMSEQSLKKLWDNPSDEIWNEYLK
ncbi:MAG: hypothetical protein ABI347_10720 [Nitrososphaera sp.]|jgi:hypothetical protein